MKNNILSYKDNLYHELSRLTKGLGSEKRIEILNILSQGPKSVEGIARATEMSVANTSRHLQILKEGHLVVTSREGNYIRYSLASKKIAQLLLLLFEVGEEELAEINAIEKNYDEMSGVPQIDLQKAIDMAKDENVLLIDTRPYEEYEAGHLPNAINIPFDEFDEKKSNLPLDKTIIVYCRGRVCGYANYFAKDLQEMGYNTYSLNKGFADWKWRID
ncbi:ArsR/SmtB family transcription factor [Streptococcus equinus]|uniref:ArsR/SmtB family transcription factor n=1 Tax=Streptococcus equinus TaxID=1335 RepID=UPI00237B89D9|nr:metalloregulator ArsR/SmtB family transcription factor [Streptococcus equinus]